MRTTTGGYEVLFGLVLEMVEGGKRIRKIVDYCRPEQNPSIGIMIIKIDPETKESFEVQDDSGFLHTCEKGYGFWKFLNAKETTVTLFDENRGYEFVASFAKIGHYVEINVSRSKLFGSDRVMLSQLTMTLIQAAATYQKRRMPIVPEAVRDLVQKFNDNGTVHFSASSIL